MRPRRISPQGAALPACRLAGSPAVTCGGPRPAIGKALKHKDLQKQPSPCGLYVEQSRHNPLAALARKWDQLSPEVQAALRALMAAFHREDRSGKQTSV